MNPIKNRTHPSSMRLISYEITNEALDIFPTSPEIEQARSDAYKIVKSKKNKKKAPEDIVLLTQKYPNDPIIAGHLALAYQNNDQYDLSEEMIFKNYEKFPYYLFAFCAYINACLSESKIEEATIAFNKRFDLTAFYPHRSLFHITEAIVFMEICARYFFVLHDMKTANRYLDILEKLDPGNHLVKKISKFYSFSNIKRILMRK